MGQRVLELSALTVGYDGPSVVRGVSLTADSGQVVALLGANGAGKTTTLRAISGLLKPRTGSISFFGADLATSSAPDRARRGIAHVPEGRGIFFGMTVAEHLRLAHRGETLNTDLTYSYFPALKKLENRKAGLLSGGEQQMLAIGRALARNPKLLLLDELSLGLAPIIVENILPVIRQHAIDHNCAVILVEQHVHLALEFADYGYVLSHGEIVARSDAATLRKDSDLLLSSYLGERD